MPVEGAGKPVAVSHDVSRAGPEPAPRQLSGQRHRLVQVRDAEKRAEQADHARAVNLGAARARNTTSALDGVHEMSPDSCAVRKR
jgi:hypothetical protein